MAERKPDGRTEGRHAPTMEHPFHRGIYNTRKDINSIVHAHPPSLVAFSMSTRKFPFDLIPSLSAGDHYLPVSAYALPGSKELGKNISHTFNSGCNAAFLENHGIIATADNLPAAFHRLENLETMAAILLDILRTGKGIFQENENIPITNELKKYSFKETEMPEITLGEISIGKEIIDIARRAYSRKLCTATSGCFSARTGSASFIITPEGEDWEYIELNDLVRASSGKAEAGKKLSQFAHLHEAIYHAHPEINAIACALPVSLMTFALSGEEFSTHTIPESYLALNEVILAGQELLYDDPGKLSRMLSGKRQNLLIRNECFLSTGSTLFQAFDRLEVAEFTAQSLISSSSLHPLKFISPEKLKDLERMFQ
ncbi:MAG: class II aldolase/adducin family protein [Bacteroidia bacterium]|nr:class II aldolase/adducin family protein [Bacteroidia bacterium]